MAPHLKLKAYNKRICNNGRNRIWIKSTKNAFYTALNKAKEELDHNPSYKWITLGYFNASISTKSKTSGSWDSTLGHNNIKINKIETNGNAERLL